MHIKSIILSGKSNTPLAKNLASRMGISIAEVAISKFANSETRIRILSDLKDKNVYLLQSFSDPANEHIIETVLLVDAASRMEPKKIVAVIPWFGYAPQDRVFRTGEPLSSEVVIKLLENTAITEFITIDIHSKLVTDKFTKPISHLESRSVFKGLLSKVIKDRSKWVVAILDKGSLERAKLFAKDLHLDTIELEKSRDRHSGKVTFHQIYGHVKNKHVLVHDDYISTGQTLFDSARYLKSLGAISYTCCVTHAVVNKTLENIGSSSIDCFITTNSVNYQKPVNYNKIITLDLSQTLADSLKIMR